MAHPRHTPPEEPLSNPVVDEAFELLARHAKAPPGFYQQVMARAAQEHTRRQRFAWQVSGGHSAWTPALAGCLLVLLALNGYQFLTSSALPDGLVGSVTRSTPDTAARAVPEEGLGDQLVKHGEYREARAAYEKALGRVSARPDRRDEARLRAKLGGVWHNLTDYAQAEEQLHQALQTYRARGDQWEEAKVLDKLGDVYHTQGAHARARDVYLQALDIFRTLGQPKAAERLQGKLGPVYKGLGDLTRALLAYESQLTPVGGPAANLLQEMLPLYYTQRDYRQVVDVASAVLVLDPAAAALAYRYRGLASKALGHLEQARQDLHQAAQRGDSEAQNALKNWDMRP